MASCDFLRHVNGLEFACIPLLIHCLTLRRPSQQVPSSTLVEHTFCEFDPATFDDQRNLDREGKGQLRRGSVAFVVVLMDRH